MQQGSEYIETRLQDVIDKRRELNRSVTSSNGQMKLVLFVCRELERHGQRLKEERRSLVQTCEQLATGTSGTELERGTSSHSIPLQAHRSDCTRAPRPPVGQGFPSAAHMRTTAPAAPAGTVRLETVTNASTLTPSETAVPMPSFGRTVHPRQIAPQRATNSVIASNGSGDNSAQLLRLSF